MVPVKVEVWALGFRLSVAGFLLQVSSKCEYIVATNAAISVLYDMYEPFGLVRLGLRFLGSEFSGFGLRVLYRVLQSWRRSFQLVASNQAHIFQAMFEWYNLSTEFYSPKAPCTFIAHTSALKYPHRDPFEA